MNKNSDLELYTKCYMDCIISSYHLSVGSDWLLVDKKWISHRSKKLDPQLPPRRKLIFIVLLEEHNELELHDAQELKIAAFKGKIKSKRKGLKMMDFLGILEEKRIDSTWKLILLLNKLLNSDVYHISSILFLHFLTK